MEELDYSIAQVRQPMVIDATVSAKEQLSDLMLRLTFTSPSFVGLEAISCADTYMKLILPDPASSEGRVMRSYSVRSHDSVAGVVEIDFALHGQGGVAALWATHVEVGSPALFKGVGGGYTPHAEAPWHLLIGDDSALPAIAVALERIGAATPTTVVLVGDSAQALFGANQERLLGIVEGRAVTLAVVDSADGVVNLVRASYADAEGTPHVFLHGEAGMVRDVRRVLLSQFQLPKSALSASGYWRSGNTDEQWRNSKREWNEAIAREDSAA